LFFGALYTNEPFRSTNPNLCEWPALNVTGALSA